MKTIRCIAFDFDGTLVDTRRLAWNILNELADKYKFRRLEDADVEKARNMTKSQFISFIGISRFRLPRILNEGRQMMHRDVQTIQPFEGIPAILEDIRPKVKTLGILTSNICQNVEAVLAAHKLAPFEFISSVPKLGRKHKHLACIMRTFSYDPKQIIYIGDETRDMIAAKKAGVRSIGVTWGFNSEKALHDAGAEFIVNNPKELTDIFNSL